MLRFLILLRYTHDLGLKRLSTSKQFEPGPSFSMSQDPFSDSMLKYGNSRGARTKFQNFPIFLHRFFSPQVFLIFDSKHGSPENYSDFFNLNYYTYVVRCWDSWTRFGTRTIRVLNDFVLLNDLSHDSHFSTRQNMETLDFLRKKYCFSLHGFFRYLTPNMALQKIILTSFVSFFFFPNRGLCVLRDISPRRYWAIAERIFAGRLRCECSCLWNFWVYSIKSISELGEPQSDKQYFEILAMRFQAGFWNIDIFHELYFVESKAGIHSRGSNRSEYKPGSVTTEN